jgi:hypothetical protein
VVHAGGSVSLTQTTTTRGPSAACTSAGVDGQCCVLSGAHAPAASVLHQLLTTVPNIDVRSRPDIAAVTARASGAVSDNGVDPADEAILAPCSTAETSAEVCTAQSPASRAPIRQNRKSGNTTAWTTKELIVKARELAKLFYLTYYQQL